MKHYKTMTEMMLEVANRNICCKSWREAISSLSITARDFRSPQERMMAQTVETIMQGMLGKYCPMCGKKL